MRFIQIITFAAAFQTFGAMGAPMPAGVGTEGAVEASKNAVKPPQEQFTNEQVMKAMEFAKTHKEFIEKNFPDLAKALSKLNAPTLNGRAVSIVPRVDPPKKDGDLIAGAVLDGKHGGKDGDLIAGAVVDGKEGKEKNPFQADDLNGMLKNLLPLLGLTGKR